MRLQRLRCDRPRWAASSSNAQAGHLTSVGGDVGLVVLAGPEHDTHAADHGQLGGVFQEVIHPIVAVSIDRATLLLVLVLAVLPSQCATHGL